MVQSRGQSVASDEMERERAQLGQKYIQIPLSLPNSCVILSKLNNLSELQPTDLKQGKYHLLISL